MQSAIEALLLITVLTTLSMATIALFDVLIGPMSWRGKVGWSLLVLSLPLIGPILYYRRGAERGRPVNLPHSWRESTIARCSAPPLPSCYVATVAIGWATRERWKAPPAEEETAEASVSPALRLLYWLYERRLVRQIRDGPIPRHVGIILDGNRRYGRRTGVHDTRRLYALGAEKLDGILAWCGELHIPAVTLWVFSTANLHRRSAEVTGVLGAVEAKLSSLTCDPRLHQGRVRVRPIRRLELLPESTQSAIRAAEKATAHYDALVLTIAVAYGGREEIVDAVRALLTEKARQGMPLAQVAATITPTEITRHLYTAGLPDPDLIIRTSGEIRLSGLLLWQSAYSEFYFSDVYWPAFRKIDFLRAIRAVQQRQRRLGL